MLKPKIKERSLYNIVTDFEERIYFLPNNISYQHQVFENAMHSAAKAKLKEYPLECSLWDYAYTEAGTPFMMPKTSLKLLSVSNSINANTVLLPPSAAWLYLMSETFLAHLILFEANMVDDDIDLYDNMLDDVVLFFSELGYMDLYEKLTS